MHVHVGALEGLTVFAYVIILAFFWHTVSAHYSDTPVGKAMAFIL